jgi:predicted dehydrogenase
MGCGVVADYGHLPAIVSTPGLELAALYDPEEAHAERESRKFGDVPFFCDSKAFFDQKLDAVVVASSAGAHLVNVLQAAKSGVHVLCEKPLATTDADAMRMIEAMEAAGKCLFTAFVYRFSPVSLQIKKWVEEGVVGEIRSLRLIYDWDLHGQWEEGPDEKWMESPRWRGRMLEGGPMVDCGVHQIDLARWWLGDEVASFASAGAWVADYAAPDHVYVHMEHARGAHTMVEMSFTYGHTAAQPSPIFTYDLIGTGGVIRYDRHGWLLESRNGQGTLTVPGASEKNFPGMYAELAKFLLTGDPGHLPAARDGEAAIRIARAATDQLIERGRPNTAAAAGSGRPGRRPASPT